MKIHVLPALRAVAAAYLTLIRRVGLLVGLGAAVLVSGVAVVYPLWFVSTNWPRSYSWGVAGLVALAAVMTLYRRLRRIADRGAGGNRSPSREEVGRKTATVALVAAAVYGTYFLATRGKTALAGVFALACFGVLGWLLGKRRR